MTPKQIFLRGVWSCIPDDRDPSWVERVAKQPRTEKPLGDYGDLTRRMLDAGISKADIARFAKIVAYETAFQILYLMTDPHGAYEGFPPGEPDLCFSLQALDAETEKPIAQLNGAYESILGMEPSGREMKPPRGT